MKLMIAIINNDDSVRAAAELNSAGFFVTKLSTTGGFLMVGNTTLLIGTDDADVPRAKEILQKTCATRKHVASSINSLGRGMKNNSLPDEVTVGGATIFVLSVDESTKL
ncbi:MAG: cyclic-di-AMP receptor [Eubacteriales bacterium]